MKKIISLFQRNYDGNRLVRDEIVPGAEWVVNGEGVPTVKWDGTACLVQDGKLYKRYDARKGKTPPANFMPAQEAPDPTTGHWPGWVPVGDGPEDQHHREAWNFECAVPDDYTPPKDGTYELLGPKVQGNPHGARGHYLEKHGRRVLDNVPRGFAGINAWLAAHPHFEGLVWHHPDGRMVKIKRKDFGLPWPVRP